MSVLPNINFYSFAPGLKPNRHLSSNISSSESKAEISSSSNEKIFKSIEAKLNSQSLELAERGKVIEELKTTLSLFIDKYNKLKDDFEKEKEMGINIALSFAKGGNAKTGQIPLAQRKSITKQLFSRLSISKLPALTYKSIDTTKSFIASLEGEKAELSAEKEKLKTQLNEIEALNATNNDKAQKGIEERNEMERKLQGIITKADEEIASLKLIISELTKEKVNLIKDKESFIKERGDLIKEKSEISKRLQSNEKAKEDLASLAYLNEDLTKKYNALETKTKDQIEALTIINADLTKERDSFQRRLQLSKDNSNEELSTLRSTIDILSKDKSDLQRQWNSSKTALEEIASLKSTIKLLTEDREDLRKQIDLFKRINKEKENEYNLNVNEYKIDNDTLRRKLDAFSDDSLLKSQKDKEAIKAKEAIELKLKESETDNALLKKSNCELNEAIIALNKQIDIHKKESNDFKTKLEENMLIMQQLETLQSKLNEISLEPLSSSKAFKQLSIHSSVVIYDFISSKAKESIAAEIQLKAQLKAIAQLQADKDALNKKVKEMNEVLTKKKSQLKDSVKSITSIKDSFISSYEVYSLSLAAIQKKLDDALSHYKAKVLKMKKALKELSNKSSNASKEKSMKEVITKLELEKDKMGIKLTNYEFHFKESNGKISAYETELGEMRNKMQMLLKENKGLEQEMKELKQKVEMYIIENSGKSKIIEERNGEIKKLKAKS